MKCSVEGCHNEDDIRPQGDKGVNLCKWHRQRWGDFYIGYECGHFGDQEAAMDARLNKKRWEKAMEAFLDWCTIEIAACGEIAESVIYHEE